MQPYKSRLLEKKPNQKINTGFYGPFKVTSIGRAEYEVKKKALGAQLLIQPLSPMLLVGNELTVQPE